MTTIPILLADHLAGEINAAVEAGAFAPLQFAARRSYPDWDEQFTGLDCIAVDVVYVSGQGSGGSVIELDSVGSLEYSPAIDIVVRKRFDPVDRDEHGRLLNASVDPLVTLLDKLHLRFAAQRNSIELEDGTSAHWVDSAVMSWVNQWKLRQAGLFEGVVRIRFTVSRPA